MEVLNYQSINYQLNRDPIRYRVRGKFWFCPRGKFWFCPRGYARFALGGNFGFALVGMLGLLAIWLTFAVTDFEMFRGVSQKAIISNASIVGRLSAAILAYAHCEPF